METEKEKKPNENDFNSNNILNTISSNIKSYSDLPNTITNKKQSNSESQIQMNNSTNANSNIINNNINNSQKTTTLNLSKIQYKDGFILKDASNSNPGFGLWSIKNEKNQPKTIIEENTIQNYDESVNSTDKKLIEELKFKCNDLEKKLQNALYQYYEKENYVRNSERMKEEFEELIHKNIEEKNFLVKENKNLEINLTHYSNALSNAKNEIERLNKIIIEQKKYILNKKEKFNEVINNEKKLQEELKNNIKILENKINEMEKNNNNFKLHKKKFKRINLFGNFVNDFDDNENEDSENKIQFQINKMKKIILDGQIEILELKNKLKKLENDKNTMKDIINFKNKKNDFQKNNLINLYQIIENQNQKQMFSNYLLKVKNKQLKNLRNKSTDNIRNIFNYNNNNKNSFLNQSASSVKIIENNFFNK